MVLRHAFKKQQISFLFYFRACVEQIYKFNFMHRLLRYRQCPRYCTRYVVQLTSFIKVKERERDSERTERVIVVLCNIVFKWGPNFKEYLKIGTCIYKGNFTQHVVVSIEIYLGQVSQLCHRFCICKKPLRVRETNRGYEGFRTVIVINSVELSKEAALRLEISILG